MMQDQNGVTAVRLFGKEQRKKESMAPKRLKDKEERIWEDETTMAESASQHFEKRT